MEQLISSCNHAVNLRMQQHVLKLIWCYIDWQYFDIRGYGMMSRMAVIPLPIFNCWLYNVCIITLYIIMYIYILVILCIKIYSVIYIYITIEYEHPHSCWFYVGFISPFNNGFGCKSPWETSPALRNSAWGRRSSAKAAGVGGAAERPVGFQSYGNQHL